MSIPAVERRATRAPKSGNQSADSVATSATVQPEVTQAGRIDFSAFLQPASIIERTLKERENPPGE